MKKQFQMKMRKSVVKSKMNLLFCPQYIGLMIHFNKRAMIIYFQCKYIKYSK